MEISWLVKYFAEFIGTAILVILGNGAIANVSLKGSKAKGQSSMLVAWGYAIGLMIPVVALGTISAFINPAFTVGLATFGLFPWSQVAQFIAFQLLGAIVGQLVVVMVYHPFYMKSDNAGDILSTFSTGDALDDGTSRSHGKAIFNGFITEFFASFIFFFGIMCATRLFYGNPSDGASADPASQAVSGVVIGLLLLGIIVSIGGPTGASMNPARDIGPRILHAILPKSVLGAGKGSSNWWYAWVPVVAPTIAAIVAVAVYKGVFGF